MNKAPIAILAMLLPSVARGADEYSNFVRQAYPSYETERRGYRDSRRAYPDDEYYYRDGASARDGRDDEYYGERDRSAPSRGHYDAREAYPPRRQSADARDRDRGRGYYDERDQRDYYPDQRYPSDRRNVSNRRAADDGAELMKFFIGADFSNFTVKFNDSSDDVLGTKYNAFTLNVGAKFTDKFGAELFYKNAMKKSTEFTDNSSGSPVPVKAETGFSGIGAGVGAYIALSDKLMLEPTLGVGQFKGETMLTCAGGAVTCGAASDDGTMGFILGAGVSFAANDNLDLRFGYRTAMFSEEKFSMKSFSEIYLGLRGIF